MTVAAEPSLIAALKTRMRWHEARQAVLAENVANAATPNFRAHKLAAPELSTRTSRRASGRSASSAPGSG